MLMKKLVNVNTVVQQSCNGYMVSHPNLTTFELPDFNDIVQSHFLLEGHLYFSVSQYFSNLAKLGGDVV